MGVATTVIPQIVIHKGHRVSVDSELYHHYESPNSSCKSWCCCCLKYSCCGLLSTILGVFVLACIGMGVMAARNGQLRRLASTETESQVLPTVLRCFLFVFIAYRVIRFLRENPRRGPDPLMLC